MKITVSSGKGGTGKTTVSVNLAAYLSEKSKVVLTDLDVEEPNSGIFIKGRLLNREQKFKAVPEWNSGKCAQNEVCRDICRFNAIVKLGKEVIIYPELCHSCYACVELCPSNAFQMKNSPIGEISHFENGKISFVEGNLDIGQEQAVPLILQTKEYVDNNFSGEFIKIFDSPPGTSCPVIEAIKNTDYLILVSESTPFGLHDLKLAYEVVRQLDINTGVIINRWGIGNESVEQFCIENNLPVIARIPNSRKIAEYYSSGQLVYDKIAEYRRELEKIEKHVMELAV